jgi:hypothetical protein
MYLDFPRNENEVSAYRQWLASVFNIGLPLDNAFNLLTIQFDLFYGLKIGCETLKWNRISRLVTTAAQRFLRVRAIKVAVAVRSYGTTNGNNLDNFPSLLKNLDAQSRGLALPL